MYPNLFYMSHKLQINQDLKSEKYFNIEVKQKEFPSCYTYNVLVMLAKRLVRNQEQKNIFKNRCVSCRDAQSERLYD